MTVALSSLKSTSETHCFLPCFGMSAPDRPVKGLGQLAWYSLGKIMQENQPKIKQTNKKIPLEYSNEYK